MPAPQFKTGPLGPYIDKDPAAELDYALDFTAWLDEDVLVSATWTVDPVGLQVTNEQRTQTQAIAWLAGGTAGETYLVACRIQTAAGRTDQRTFRVVVVQR